MARVIKGGQSGKPRRAVPRAAEKGRRVISKDLFAAQQKAQEIIKAGEEAAAHIVEEGKKKAAQAREEAQSEGAQEAFAEAAQEALRAFRNRALKYQDATADVEAIAVEVFKRVVGRPPALNAEERAAIVAEGLDELRARRRLRLQLSDERLTALGKERPQLMAGLAEQPDFLLEGAVDVSQGFTRVVTEVGGAMCAEQDALDALAETLGIEEQAVAPRPPSALHHLDDVAAAASRVSAMPEDSDDALLPSVSDEDDPGWESAPSEEGASDFERSGGTARVSGSGEELWDDGAFSAESGGGSAEALPEMPDLDDDDDDPMTEVVQRRDLTEALVSAGGSVATSNRLKPLGATPAPPAATAPQDDDASEKTMALEVEELRKELKSDDDLDLYADEEV